MNVIFLLNLSKNHRFLIFLIISENPDLADVHIAIKHAKIDEISKFQKNSKTWSKIFHLAWVSLKFINQRNFYSILKFADFLDFRPHFRDCAKKANLRGGHLYMSHEFLRWVEKPLIFGQNLLLFSRADISAVRLAIHKRFSFANRRCFRTSLKFEGIWLGRFCGIVTTKLKIFEEKLISKSSIVRGNV